MGVRVSAGEGARARRGEGTRAGLQVVSRLERKPRRENVQRRCKTCEACGQLGVSPCRHLAALRPASPPLTGAAQVVKVDAVVGAAKGDGVAVGGRELD